MTNQEIHQAMQNDQEVLDLTSLGENFTLVELAKAVDNYPHDLGPSTLIMTERQMEHLNWLCVPPGYQLRFRGVECHIKKS